MVWRRIFTPLYGEPEDDVSLAAGGQLADYFKAHLDVVLIKPDPATYVPPVGLGKIADDMRAALVNSAEDAWSETENQLREKFSGVTEREGLAIAESPRGPGAASARFAAIEADDEKNAWLRYARASDATVAALPSKEGRGSAARIAQEILFKSGRPVLSLPTSGLPAEIKRIGIAWDGDDEVVHSLAAARPFLSMAAHVDVVTVDQPQAPVAHPEDIVEYLAWHGVTAEAHVLEPNYQSIGDRLLEVMDDRAWNMVVMGAYGRGRLLENLFAGPTRGVPWQAKIPVLQAH